MRTGPFISCCSWSLSKESQAGQSLSSIPRIYFSRVVCRLAYVNVFYRLGNDEDESSVGGDSARRSLEREFCISSVGFADTLGILVASLVSIALEPWLCRVQVRRGRTLCQLL